MRKAVPCSAGRTFLDQCQEKARQTGWRGDARDRCLHGFCKAAGNSENSNAADKLTFGTRTRLAVRPIVEKTNPSVYQLEDPNRTICLVTDFKPEDNETSLVSSSVSGSRMFTGKVTAVDMKSTYSKSMGMLVWSNTSDLSCESAFNSTLNFHLDNGVPCNATIVEKGFETDIHLNYQNLNVIVLRVLLLKMAGFNLLMTVRLWSS